MSFSNAGSFIKLLRIHSWYYLLGIPLLAVIHEGETAGSGKWAIVFGFASIYFCWGYVFNNLFDRDEDAASRNSFKTMEWRRAATIAFSLQLVLIILAAENGLVLETLAVVLVNTLYSVPPCRLKRFLLPSLISNGIFFSFPYYASLRLLNSQMGPGSAHFILFVFLLFQPLQYIHFLEHKEDEGQKVSLRHRAAAAVLFGALCVAAVYADAGDRAGLVLSTGLYSAVCLSMLFYFKSASRARVAVRYASMILGLYLALSAQFR